MLSPTDVAALWLIRAARTHRNAAPMLANGGDWSFGELLVSFGLSAQVVPKSEINNYRKRASFGNQSILTRRNDKVSHLLHTKYSLNYEYCM